MGAFSSIRRESVKPFLAPSMPDDEFEELCWQDGELVLLVSAQDKRSTNKRLPCHAGYSNPVSDDQNLCPDDHEEASFCDRKTSLPHTERECDVIKGRWDMNVAAVQSFSQDIPNNEEMIAWLHYPELQPVMLPAVSCLPSLTIEQKKGKKQSDDLNHVIGSDAMTKKQSNAVDMVADSTNAVATTSETQNGKLQVEPSNDIDPLKSLIRRDPCTTQQYIEHPLDNLELVSSSPEIKNHVVPRESAENDVEQLEQQGGRNEGTDISNELLQRRCLESPNVQHPLDSEKLVSQEMHHYGLASNVMKLPSKVFKNTTQKRNLKSDGNNVKHNGTGTKFKDPAKHPQSQGKRNRAADLHNKAEKKRRDKINEKLKALQNLIPNANKTAKASVLEDAIEYLKTLQSQISMMSRINAVPIPVIHGAQTAMHMGANRNVGMMDKSTMQGAHACVSPLPSAPQNNGTNFPRFVIANAPSFLLQSNPSLSVQPVNQGNPLNNLGNSLPSSMVREEPKMSSFCGSKQKEK